MARSQRALGQDCRIATTSNSSVTLSLMNILVAAIQLMSQSMRLIVALPWKPTVHVPHGSFSTLVSRKSTVTGHATPRIVRWPTTVKLFSSVCCTLIDLRVMV